jgi:hypothetical protein
LASCLMTSCRRALTVALYEGAILDADPGSTLRAD